MTLPERLRAFAATMANDEEDMLLEAADEIERLQQHIGLLEDDVKKLDDLCWYCANPDIEAPWRHIHDIEGKGVIAHWHHSVDPGDGLPSPCKNSERLEEVFQEFASRFCQDHGEEVRDGCQMCKVDKLEDEIERLKKIIKDAPHYFYCGVNCGIPIPCTCWKKDVDAK